MNNQLIGTWKLVSVKARDLDTGEERDAWGPNPKGYINYAPDGRMIVINARSGRSKPKGPAPTPQEAADLFQGMLAYAGSYSVNGNEVTTSMCRGTRPGPVPTWCASRSSTATACTSRRARHPIRSTAG